MNSVNRKKIIVGLLISIAIIIVILIHMNAPTQRLRKHLSLGDKYLSELKYEDAILAYEAAIAIEPRNEAAYIGTAYACIGLNDYENALDITSRAISILGETEELLSMIQRIKDIKYESDIDYFSSNLGWAKSFYIGNPWSAYDRAITNDERREINKSILESLSEYEKWIDENKNDHPELTTHTRWVETGKNTYQYERVKVTTQSGKVYFIKSLYDVYKSKSIAYLLMADYKRAYDYRKKMVDGGARDPQFLEDGHDGYIEGETYRGFIYDKYGRVIQETPEEAGAGKRTFIYNNEDNTLIEERAEYPQSIYIDTYEYDDGRLVKSTQIGNYGTPDELIWITNYVYPDKKNMIAETLGDTGYTKKERYEIDERGIAKKIE